MRKCKQCGCKYEPTRPMQVVCWNIDCLIAYSDKVKEKKIKLAEKKDRENRIQRKAALKTPQEWLKDALTVFQKWVRLRDKDLPCISCQRHHQGQYHGGHYRSRGSVAGSALAFEPDNCHKQCKPCNVDKSGNAIEYRINLLAKIGPERLAYLEGPHELKRWSVDELKAIIRRYKALIAELDT